MTVRRVALGSEHALPAGDDGAPCGERLVRLSHLRSRRLPAVLAARALPILMRSTERSHYFLVAAKHLLRLLADWRD